MAQDGNRIRYSPAKPVLPENLKLRDYQTEAVDAWFDYKCQGFLEMATGSGKTITSLAASVRLFEQEKRLAVILAVPYQHLVDQWNKEARAFGYRPVLAYRSKRQWLNKLKTEVMRLQRGISTIYICYHNASNIHFIGISGNDWTFRWTRFVDCR